VTTTAAAATALDTKKDYEMPGTTIQIFTYEHLPAELQKVSKPMAELARLMDPRSLRA
jgi:hypothetical protein